MRKIFKELHLWLSIPFGLLITVICLTGAILVFEKEITQCVESRLYKVKYNEGDEKLAPSNIVARAKEQLPDSIIISGIEIFSSPHKASMLRYNGSSRRDAISVNPYTGEVLGYVKWNSFFKTMFYLHRFMMDPPTKRGVMSTGKLIVALSTIVMMVITITGLVIWFPRSRSRNYLKIVKSRLKFSVSKGWKRFWYDSHLSLGFYSALVVLLMGITGLTWSFSSVRQAAYSMLGADKKEKSKVVKIESGSSSLSTESPWDNAFNELNKLYPEYQSITISKGKADVKPRPHSKNPFLRDSYKFGDSGALEEVVYYKNQSQSSKAKGIIYTLHTGSFGGIFFKIIYFIIALIAASLPISGYYLWIKKKLRRSNR